MAENSFSIMFWCLAVAGVVSAIAAVTLQKSVLVFKSAALNTAVVAGLMMYLGIAWFAILYLALAAAAAGVFYFVLGKKVFLDLNFRQFHTNERAGGYFIAALLIFTSCLALIANTDVWRYVSEEQRPSFSEFWPSLIENYSLLIIFVTVFITLLAFIMFIKPRPKAD